MDRETLKEIMRDVLREELKAVIQPKPVREWWKPSAVAREFGFKDTETVRKMCKDGKIRAEKDEFSKQWRIPNAAVVELAKIYPQSKS